MTPAQIAEALARQRVHDVKVRPGCGLTPMAGRRDRVDRSGSLFSSNANSVIGLEHTIPVDEALKAVTVKATRRSGLTIKVSETLKASQKKCD
jgi:hypothetical protein